MTIFTVCRDYKLGSTFFWWNKIRIFSLSFPLWMLTLYFPPPFSLLLVVENIHWYHKWLCEYYTRIIKELYIVWWRIVRNHKKTSSPSSLPTSPSYHESINSINYYEHIQVNIKRHLIVFYDFLQPRYLIHSTHSIACYHIFIYFSTQRYIFFSATYLF